MQYAIKKQNHTFWYEEKAECMYFVVISVEPYETLLTAIKSIANGKVSKPAHVTIQGPLSEPPQPNSLEEIGSKISNVTLKVTGTGLFENPGKTALFLKLTSDGLECVWNKPHYPVEQFGLNPHITLYEGSDLVLIDHLKMIISSSFMNRLSFLASKVLVMGNGIKHASIAFDLSRLIYPEEDLILEEFEHRLEKNSTHERLDLIDTLIKKYKKSYQLESEPLAVQAG